MVTLVTLIKMDEMIYDLGVYMTPSQLENLKIIIKTLFNNDLTKFELTASSGLSIIIVNKYCDCVHQYYLSKDLYKKVLDNVNKLNQTINHGFVKFLSSDDKLQLITYEKVEPINGNAFDTTKLKNDVFKTLKTMKELGISHGDLVLDNIGYSKIDNQYLIYDFETVKFDVKESNDLYTFLKSIKFHVGF